MLIPSSPPLLSTTLPALSPPDPRLALGYLNQPTDTAKKFVPTPAAVSDVLPECGPPYCRPGRDP